MRVRCRTGWPPRRSTRRPWSRRCPDGIRWRPSRRCPRRGWPGSRSSCSPPSGAALHDRITELARSAGFEIRVAQEAGHMQTILGLVAAEVGVSVVPRTMAALRQPDVVFQRLDPEPAPLPMQLVWRHGDTSPVVRTFRAMLTAAPSEPRGRRDG
ncbi:LysR substrate-binding domain-containing protein [Streptomyces nogalater]